MLILCSCSTAPPIHRTALPGENPSLPVRYSLVFLIHGDGDYLFHDAAGVAHHADEEILRKAKTVAGRNPLAEVFIFHEKPKNRAFFLFSRPDGAFYYYRNGKLVARESCRRKGGASRYDFLSGFCRRCRAGGEDPRERFFLYFGHEIPETGGRGYDASHPGWKFTIHDLAGGMKQVFGDSARIDLTVLSTCFGGTPHTISELAPLARYIVASPGNLHLSYFDLRPLERLETGFRDGVLPSFACAFARNAFDCLSAEVQTAVTVAVYDASRVEGYLRAVAGRYDQLLASLPDKPLAAFERCDCAEDSAFTLPGMRDGVEVFFRPARFGRARQKQTHSGWECWRGKKL